MTAMLRWGGFTLMAGILCQVPLLSQTPSAERALLDQYCVTCHNDKTKIANFSLQSADINASAIIPKSGNRSSASCAPA